MAICGQFIDILWNILHMHTHFYFLVPLKLSKLCEYSNDQLDTVFFFFGSNIIYAQLAPKNATTNSQTISHFQPLYPFCHNTNTMMQCSTNSWNKKKLYNHSLEFTSHHSLLSDQYQLTKKGSTNSSDRFWMDEEYLAWVRFVTHKAIYQ